MKTTKKHFEYFKERCEHWIGVFGLQDWEVYYEHSPGNGIASCKTNNDGRAATLFLRHDWQIEVTNDELDRCAFHEVTHILMALSIDRYTTWGDADGHIHSVINKLYSIIVKGKHDIRVVLEDSTTEIDSYMDNPTLSPEEQSDIGSKYCCAKCGVKGCVTRWSGRGCSFWTSIGEKPADDKERPGDCDKKTCANCEMSREIDKNEGCGVTHCVGLSHWTPRKDTP